MLAYDKLPTYHQRQYLAQFESAELPSPRIRSLRCLTYYLDSLLSKTVIWRKTSTTVMPPIPEEEEEKDGTLVMRTSRSAEEMNQLNAANIRETYKMIEEEMGKIPPLKDEEDVAGLRELLIAISANIKRHHSERFKLTILLHLLRKLPPKMAEKYAASLEAEEELPNKKALLLLRHYLGNHLVDLYARPPEARRLEMTVQERKRLLTVIQEELEPLQPIADRSDIGAIQPLLAVIAQARFLVRPFGTTEGAALETEFFNAIWEKLPEDVRSLHSASAVKLFTYRHKSLAPLSRTLTTLINNYRLLKSSVIVQETNGVTSLSSPPSSSSKQTTQTNCVSSSPTSNLYPKRLFFPSSSPNPEKTSSSSSEPVSMSSRTIDWNEDHLNGPPKFRYCGYCKTMGHHTTDCCLAKSMLCYNCFEVGHKAKFCTAQTLRTGNPYFGHLSPTTITSMPTASVLPPLPPKMVKLPDGQLFGPRYGDLSFCLECCTFGHRAANCRLALCFTCNQRGHMSSHCPSRVESELN